MRLISLLCFGLTILLSLLIAKSKSDNSPGFFLKITKNVPRLGRRSDSYFLKNMKTIPRIGRRTDGDVGSNPSVFSDFASWLEDQPTTQSKRVLLSPAALSAATDSALTVVQPVNSNTLIELLDKNAISSDKIKFVHWKDFDRALQLDMELYAKVISLGRKPDQRLKEDISNNFGSYVPLYSSNTNNGDAGADFMLYNNKAGNNERMRYETDLLNYNYLK